jgi:hypothetical protein
MHFISFADPALRRPTVRSGAREMLIEDMA